MVNWDFQQFNFISKTYGKCFMDLTLRNAAVDHSCSLGVTCLGSQTKFSNYWSYNILSFLHLVSQFCFHNYYLMFHQLSKNRSGEHICGARELLISWDHIMNWTHQGTWRFLTLIQFSCVSLITWIKSNSYIEHDQHQVSLLVCIAIGLCQR